MGLNLNKVGQVSPQTPVLVIVSGYFSPLHSGHLDYLESAAKIADQLIVIVNNNEQQILKKGKLILDEQDRLRIILALKIVDEAMIAIDKDRSVAKSLALIAESNPNASLIFGNGGDRNSEDDIPEKYHGLEIIQVDPLRPLTIIKKENYSGKNGEGKICAEYEEANIAIIRSPHETDWMISVMRYLNECDQNFPDPIQQAFSNRSSNQNFSLRQKGPSSGRLN